VVEVGDQEVGVGGGAEPHECDAAGLPGIRSLAGRQQLAETCAEPGPSGDGDGDGDRDEPGRRPPLAPSAVEQDAQFMRRVLVGGLAQRGSPGRA
jgi:hypothetical protein